MANTITNRTVGRPRAAVKLPRKKYFTVADVVQINPYTPLTIRSNLNFLIEIGKLVQDGVTRTKRGKRGRPSYRFTKVS